jgi:threonine synthase
MPDDAPAINHREAVMTGAHAYLVRGLISDAGTVIGRYVAATGAFDASTLREPYRIEGKKTMGFEIAEQFGWELPSVILYPAGGGVGIIGIWKALAEMEALGWIHGRWPRLMVVQAEGCQPLVQAFEGGRETSTFWQGASTIASGIRVPKALGDALVLRAVRETEGRAIAVSDQDILQAQRETARQEGLWICPEGAAAVAAAARLRAQGFIRQGERVVVLNTGTGLKYPELVAVDLPVLAPGAPIPALPTSA